MEPKKNLSQLAALLPAAVCLLLTLFVALPNAAGVNAYLQNAVSALNAAPADEGFQNLNAVGEPTEPATAKTGSAVPPLEIASDPETTAPAAPAQADSAWQTPADILAAQTAYLEKYKDAPPAGTVTERFFVNDGATDLVGNVAVRNCTDQRPDFAALLDEGAPLEKADLSQPLVLIFHTHTTEGYLPAFTGDFYKDYVTRSADPAMSVVRVGDAICEALEAQGIGVIHDTKIYDEAYDGAYARSRADVQAYLEQYPSIQITLDIHRDAIWDSDTAAIKPTAEIDGRKAAQVMIITGVEEGPVTVFPHWRENLRFALALQNSAQALHEGLMKPVYFCRRRYNMDLTPCSLLLEFGSDTNTLEEAVYAGALLGEALAGLIHANA